MHCSRLVWNRTAEINFGLRPNFGLRLKSQTKRLVWDFSLRPKLSVTLLFALIRSQTCFLVSDQGLKLWFQRKIKWPAVGWATGRASVLQKVGCWYVVGDHLTWSSCISYRSCCFHYPCSNRFEKGDILVPSYPWKLSFTLAFLYMQDLPTRWEPTSMWWKISLCTRALDQLIVWNVCRSLSVTSPGTAWANYRIYTIHFCTDVQWSWLLLCTSGTVCHPASLRRRHLVSNQIKSHLLHSGSHEAGTFRCWLSPMRVPWF